MTKLLAGLIIALLFPALASAQSLDEEQADYIRANAIFTLYHELGHAMIDLLRLPVLGQEEDAADVLGVVLSEMINAEEDNEYIMLATADNFAYLAEADAAAGYELAFWDMHGLDQQRYYTILCLHYGADPDRRQATADDQDLPEERQETCAEEYTLAEESWGPVLDDSARQSPGADWLTLVIADQPEDAVQAVLLDAMQTEAKILNEVFDPGFELDLIFAKCDESNAFYDPEAQEMTICAELGEQFLN